jgi:pimeloyl-ACP methyl ester carboxylesterase
MELSQPIDKFADINGLSLHYLDWGNPERPPVLLLHGFTAHAGSWNWTALNLRDCYHVLALDQRGHGRSWNSEEMLYSIDDHFTDISIFIETLGLKDLVLIGHSMGGRNALFYTACRPDNVSRLILVDARPGNSTGASAALKEHLAVLPLEVEKLDEAVQVIRDMYPRIPEDDCFDLASYGYRKTAAGIYETRFDSRMLSHTQKSGYSAESLWNFMDNVKCPTLIIRGKESDFLSLEDAQEMNKKIHGSILVEIPDATHMPAQENRDVFCRVVLDFLKGSEDV